MLERGRPVGWGWGPEQHVLACRVSQVLGLLAVLALLLLTGVVAP